MRDGLTCTTGELGPDGGFLSGSGPFYSPAWGCSDDVTLIGLDKETEHYWMFELTLTLLHILPPGQTKPKSNTSSADSLL